MLSVVIPVYNDPEGLVRLLRQIEEMAIFAEVIVCDDASTIPCRPQDLGIDEAAGRITYLRSETQGGAGRARNIGLDAVTTEQVIFFDSDDLFLPDFIPLTETLAGMEFDFCLFRHIDSRERARGVPGPMSADQERWERAGVRSPRPRLLTLASRLDLVEIAAYPWNKVYRTAFLREAGVRCTEILIHNDIELHWASFLQADRVLASSALGCEHFVTDHGSRLTNRRGRERIDVLEALTHIYEILPYAALREAFTVPYPQFYMRLFGWVLENLDPEYHPEFRRAVAKFLLRWQDEASMTQLANRAPLVARDVVAWIREGHA